MNNSTTQKLSVLEKVGYSLGDLAANLIFQTLVTFIAFFYRILLSKEKNPPIDEVVEANLVPYFIQFLTCDDSPQLQFEVRLKKNL